LLLVPRIRDMPIERRVIGATVLSAVAIAALALLHDAVSLFIAVFVVGTAFIVASSSLNFVAYNSVASWVRTRVVSVHQMIYYGGVATGSIVWGIVAEIWGVQTALLAAASGLVIGLVLSLRYKLKPQTDVDMTPSMHWAMPRIELDIRDHDDGSALVEIEYLIDTARSNEFESAMHEIRSLRLRDGAINWGLFHDVENPSRYVETFISESWTDHMRQHERITKADALIEDRIRTFHIGKDPPRVSHLIGENTFKRNHKSKKRNEV